MSQTPFRILLVFCLLSGVVYAQQGTGAIFGTVTDAQDAVVAGRPSRGYTGRDRRGLPGAVQ